LNNAHTAFIKMRATLFKSVPEKEKIRKKNLCVFEKAK